MGEYAPDPNAVSGTSHDPVATDPTAESINTDGRGGPPENVPYARFKEVNDRYVPYRELERLGYDVDSLRQLAVWNANFTQDPVGNWLEIAQNLEGLPPDLKALVENYNSDDDSDDSSPGYVDTEGEDDEEEYEDDSEMPQWARDLQEFKATQEERDRVQAETRDRAARLETLNSITTGWADANKKEGLEELPEEVMLSFIAGAAGTGRTAEQILEQARSDWMTVRELAQGHIRRSGPMPSPRVVPGSAVVTGSDTPKPKSLDEVNKIIEGVWDQL